MRNSVKVLVSVLVMSMAAGCKSSGPSSTPADAGVDSLDGATPPDSLGATCGMDFRTQGEGCSCSQQCQGGFCVDGVCCESACGSACMSCGLPNSLGSCRAIPPGEPPRAPSDCKAEDTSTCGLDGTCDGTGQCRTYVEGTVCKPGTCEGDSVVGTHVCDGARGCKQGATTVCAPFSCSAATNECVSKCASDLECVVGRKCVAASCGPKMNGSVCELDGECASEHCADGVCCNTACDGDCRACNLVGQLGICQAMASGVRDPSCSQQTPLTCGTTGQCDGFGSCTVYSAGTVCAPSTCSGSIAMNTARACDGLGVCQPSETVECGTYRCATGRCNSACTTAADCAPGIACVNNNCGPKVDGQVCAEDGDCLNLHCVRDTPTGTGICCNSECTGACRSCAIAGSLGRCTSVPAAVVDPRGVCIDRTAATCGTDGRCNGAGACRLYTAGTVCAADTCASDIYTAPSTCNGSGLCVKPAATSCSPYHCNTNRCFMACTSDLQCVPPNSCGMNGVISSCGLKPRAASCSANNECASNFCAQGVCCNSACNTACRACNLAGTAGTCSNVSSGADPRRLCLVQAATTCGTTGQCAAGQCARWTAGTQCRGASCANASTRTPPSTCDGAGVCAAAANTTCAPGRCDTATSSCTRVCTTDAQCTAPGVCIAGTCSPKLATGSVCTVATNCLSGFCVDGRCCGTACTGACQTCGNATGLCGAVTNGTRDTLCGTAAPPCGRTGLCTGGACAVAATGTDCSDGEACNGVEACLAGVCRADPATVVTCRPLDACHVAGTCTAGVCSNPNAPPLTPCGAGPVCRAGSLKAQDRCTAGACVPGAPTPCASGTCADTMTCAPMSLPECGALQDCSTSPPECVCPAGRACGTLLHVCLPS